MLAFPVPLLAAPGNEVCRTSEGYGALKAIAVNRLSKAEFSQTIPDLIGADVAGALPALSGLLAGIPDDDRQAGFANITWTLSANHVSAYLGIANEIGSEVSRQDLLREKLVPCARGSGAISDACLKSFVETFGSRAYRRRLDPGEAQDLIAFFHDSERKSPGLGLGSLITRILLSPNFLFKDGAGVQPAGDCARQLDDDSFRLASRMAYGLWGRMPDAQLFSAAKRHDLLDDSKLFPEIERMVRDDKTKEWMRAFFREWLHYDHIPVEGYTWPFLGKIDRAHLHESAAEELDRFIDATVWTEGGSFYDLMTSRRVITSAPAIRQIYGLPAVQPGGPEQLPTNRSGMLTRVALLAQGHDEASTVKRGAFVRRQLLCDAITPPDPSLLPAGSLVPPPPDYHLTTRQRWEQRTSPPACQGCHRRINAFGFSLEAYDGIGRFQQTERQIIPNSKPEAYNELTIDTAVVPNIERPTEPVMAEARALSEFIGKNPKANRCFVRQLAKFVSGRTVGDDLEKLDALADEMMAPGGNIHDVLVGIVKNVVRQYDAGN